MLTYEKNLTTGVIREYAYLNDQIIGWQETDNTGNSVKRYAATDLLGSVTTVTDESGTVLWSGEYTAFGNVAYGSGNVLYKGMYTGKDIDSETGLTYHWNRWRSEDGSSFISEDPARDGSNWYGYCGNNPINFTDPTGLYVDYGNGGREEVPDEEVYGPKEDTTTETTIPDTQVPLPQIKDNQTLDVTAKSSGVELDLMTLPKIATQSPTVSFLQFIITSFKESPKAALSNLLQNTTLTFGVFQTDFTFDDNAKTSFSANYFYYVQEKKGLEISFGSVSLITSEGTKSFSKTSSKYDIADDFTLAGTESYSFGTGIGPLSGTVGGSTSGGWNLKQSNFGFSFIDAGIPPLPMGLKTTTQTKLLSKRRDINE